MHPHYITHTNTHKLFFSLISESSPFKKLLPHRLNMLSNLLTSQPYFHQQHNVWGWTRELWKNSAVEQTTGERNWIIKYGSSLGLHFPTCDLPLAWWIIANRLFLQNQRGAVPPGFAQPGTALPSEMKMRQRLDTRHVFVVSVQHLQWRSLL